MFYKKFYVVFVAGNGSIGIPTKVIISMNKK